MELLIAVIVGFIAVAILIRVAVYALAGFGWIFERFCHFAWPDQFPKSKLAGRNTRKELE